MQDFPIKHIEDADEVNRNIDEQTSGHVRKLDDADAELRRLADAGDESTEGHKRRTLDDADAELRRLADADESTEGHLKR